MPRTKAEIEKDIAEAREAARLLSGADCGNFIKSFLRRKEDELMNLASEIEVKRPDEGSLGLS